MAGSFACAQFGPFVPFTQGGPGVTRLLVLDLDMDGDNDILHVEQISDGSDGALFWHENVGQGAFLPSVPWLGLGGQTIFQKGIGAGDLDGDGDLDLVARLMTEPETRWFRNTGAAFEPMPAFSGQLGSGLCAPYDIDGDGDMDLLFANSGGSVALNTDGLGTFGPLLELDLPVAPRDVDMADADGDGDLDLLAIWRFATFSYLSVSMHDDGAGAFAPHDVVNQPPPYLAEWNCAWMDMDGDGDLDPVVAIANLYYYPNSGTGTFSGPVDSGILSGVMRGMDATDIDGDGDRDLVGGTGNRLQWVEATAPGAFTSHYSSPAPGLIECTAFADVDGDGDIDAVTASASARFVSWNERVAGNFGPWHLLSLAPANPTEIVAADIDGDGDQDAVLSARTNNSVTWFPNADGQGTFGPMSIVTLTADSALSVDVADIDGDGDLDLAVAEGSAGSVIWMENASGDGTTWQEHVIASGLVRPNQVRLKDLNGDGLPEAVFTSIGDKSVRLAVNNGGVYGAASVVATTLFNPYVLRLADLSGDALHDVIVGGYTGSSEQVRWFAALPGGLSFDAGSAALINSQYLYDISVGDADQDGDNDLFVCRTANGTLSLLRNNAGTFAAPVDLAVGYNLSRCAVADMDGDGLIDAVGARSSSNNGMIWARGTGAGAYSVPALLNSTLGYSTGIGIADIDADGDLDLLACGETNAVAGSIESYFGAPFRITGNVFLDLDGSGSLSAGDSPATFIPVVAAPQVTMPFSDSDSNYTLYLPEGSYTVAAPFVSPCWTLSTPSGSYTETYPPGSPVRAGRDFGYAIACDTTIVSVEAMSGPICVSQNDIDFNLYNTGTTSPEGLLRVVLDPLATFVSSEPTPWAVSGDTVWLALGAIGPFQHTEVSVRMHGPGAASLGDTLHFSADFLAVDDLGNPLGTFGTAWSQIVLCSYDPNDKTVTPAGFGADGLIPLDTERLTFRVRFQNTGNASASSVTILDQIAPELDLSTLHVLGWSHPFTLEVDAGREARFHFAEIDLPHAAADSLASQGHVIYSIALASGLPHGTVIENTARIIFDLNPPIITNTTVNTLYDCGLAVASLTDLGSGVLLANAGSGYQWLLEGQPIAGATGPSFTALQSGNYSVMVTDSIGCAPTSSPVFVLVTGIAEDESAGLRLSPNPFSSSFTLTLPAAVQRGGTVEVLDPLGRVVRAIAAQGDIVTIEGEGLPNGLLMVTYTQPTGGEVFRARVVHLE